MAYSPGTVKHTASPRVLWVATKAPLPILDGGRLVMAATLDGLAVAGVEVTLVAPTIGDSASRGPSSIQTHLVDARPRAWGAAALASVRSGRPVSVERHAIAAVADCVADLVQRQAFDVVHVEQPQALAAARPAMCAGVACVLRAQNVESLVWEAVARAGGGGLAMRIEARRMRRFEAAALAAVDATIALSDSDARLLSSLDPSARVVVVAPPAAGPIGSGDVSRLDGTPALVWMGSAGWWPNEDGRRWLLSDIWPAIRARVPGARLHVFGGSSRGDARQSDTGIISHVAPADSGLAFAPESILLLPLRIAVGVRMRLLEAWERGIPVVASPAAVEGLDAVDGRDVLIAADGLAFAAAVARLAASPALRAQLVEGGRATLARRHDPSLVARLTIDVYREAIDRRASATAAR